jgi:hypothetical protein
MWRTGSATVRTPRRIRSDSRAKSAELRPTGLSPLHSGGDQINDRVWDVLDAEDPFLASR